MQSLESRTNLADASALATHQGGNSPRTALQRERRFFLIMSFVMLGITVSGFALQFLAGRSTFAVPIVYHLHAATFGSWVLIYVTQNWLVVQENVRMHRMLGVIALIWVPLLIALGSALTIVSLRHGAPFFFDAREFFFVNLIQLAAFAILIVTGLAIARRPDWHKRLMYCGMTILMGPGIVRLLPAPLLVPFTAWSYFLVSLLLPITGMIADRRRAGRVHPAWFWGIAVLVAAQIIGEVVAYSAVGSDITRKLTAGTRGANRPLVPSSEPYHFQQSAVP